MNRYSHAVPPSRMSRVKCWQVNAFTHRPFGGNPAAVCWLEEEADPVWMQAVAAEMNLSETAFVRRLGNDYELRWFTPMVEVDLCGHATLAAAHTLWFAGITDEATIRFQTRSGRLGCTRAGDFIELKFPSLPPAAVIPAKGLLEALGAENPRFVGKGKYDYLIAFDSPEEVRRLQPDFRQLVRIPTRGIIATAPADLSGYDFISRFFCPSVGIDEDPVCGSAHCCLTPYWAAELGKTELMAFQASARGGILRVRLGDDHVYLGGQAVTIWQGELL